LPPATFEPLAPVALMRMLLGDGLNTPLPSQNSV
jgi:hypothetical protein